MKIFLLAALSATIAVPVLACEDCAKIAVASTKTVAAKPPVGVKTTTLSAPKMHCAGCAMGIKAALSQQVGVRSVEADPKSKLVVVTYVSAKQNPKMLAAALTKAGWPAQEVKTGAAKANVAP